MKASDSCKIQDIMKKYYKTLGLDMAASIDEVEQAYKELSETWNPQTYQNLPRYRRKLTNLPNEKHCFMG